MCNNLDTMRPSELCDAHHHRRRIFKRLVSQPDQAPKVSLMGLDAAPDQAGARARQVGTFSRIRTSPEK